MADETGAAEVSTVPTETVLNYANEVAKKYNVAPELVRGIILAENSGKSGVLPKILPTDRVSSKGAYGIGQTMAETHTQLKAQGYLPADHTLDTWQGQVDAVGAALKEMSKTHRTNDPAVLAAAYNGGTAAGKNVAAGNYQALPAETVDYLEKLHKIGVASQPTRGQGTVATTGRIQPPPISGDEMAAREGITPAPSQVPASGVPSVAITSISEATPPPGMPRNTVQRGIDALMELTRENSTVLGNLVNDITNSTAEAVRIHSDAAKQVEAAGRAEGDAASITAMIEAAGADTRSRILRIANMDTKVADNAFATALAERSVLRSEREKIAAEIDRRQGVGFFDSPLDWLINQTVLPGQIAQHNALARKERDNIQRVDTLQREVANQEATDQGATSDYYLRLGTAAQRAKIATGMAKSAELNAGASAMQAQRVLSIARLRETQFGQAESALKWGIELERRAEDGTLKEQERAQIAEFDRGAKIIGSLIGADNVSFLSLKGRGPKVQNEWKTRVDSLSLGDSLFESTEFVRNYGNIPVMRQKGAGELADMFASTNREIDKRAQEIKDTWAERHPELSTKPPKDVEAREMAARQLQLNWEKQRDNDMTRADPNSPFVANHYKMALVYKGNTNNPVYQMVKDAQQRNQKLDDKTLVTATMKLVETGVLQPREAAAAMSEYYSYVLTANNTGRSLKAVGMDEQKNYVMRPDPKMRGFDAVNFTQAENFFTQFAARRAAETRGVYGIDWENQEFVPNPAGTQGYTIQYKKKPPTDAERVLEQDKIRREKERTNPSGGMTGVRG